LELLNPTNLIQLNRLCESKVSVQRVRVDQFELQKNSLSFLKAKI